MHQCTSEQVITLWQQQVTHTLVKAHLQIKEMRSAWTRHAAESQQNQHCTSTARKLQMHYC